MADQPDLHELYGIIIESFQGSILVVDATGTIVYANKQGLKLAGRKKVDLVGKTVYELMDEHLFSNSTLADCLESRSMEINYLYIDDDLDRGMLAVTIPHFDKDGNITHAVAFSQSERFAREYNAKIEKEKKQRLSTLIDYITGPAVDFIAASPKMATLYEMAEKISGMDATVLVTGESGTGKEVLARFIHSHSQRHNHIMIPVNCASIPAELVESEFFGYERGAFTGADKDGKHGLFEIADGGTLFLDEIGELPLPIQSKLLRVLESGEFKRVGGNKEIRTDVRIVAATNRDLPEMVRENRFREDLYYRLNVLPLTIPPLRERVEDIEPLMRLFLARFNKKHNRLAAMDPVMIAEFKQYPWPGNVRELRNLIERFVITGVYSFSNGAPAAPSPGDQVPAPVDPVVDAAPLPYKTFMDTMEKRYLESRLARNHGDIAGLAKEMEIHISGVYRKLEKHGLDARRYK